MIDFINDDLETLRMKMRYMDYIPDALTQPQEMWYHPDDNTTYFLLRLTKDITFVAMVIDGIFQDFDVIENDEDKVNALRCGILKYAVKQTE